jgi:4-diphosphocytidyl-2-C-methyl-D-erythritol kinase
VAAGAAIRSGKGRHPADRGQARPWARAAADHGARRLSTPDAGNAAFTAFAPAKINLFLHISGRRADGYHLLDSLVAFADIGDTVTATLAEGLSLTVRGPEAGALGGLGDDNLVLRAARALAAHCGVAPNAALTLDKELPVASGIGGGSSDAAAALRALAALWRFPLDDVAALAAALGADVPVCLAGQPARVGGIGEQLELLPRLPELGIVLANPRRELPTPAVFRARQGAFQPAAHPAADFSDPEALPEALIAALAPCRNDLTDAALSLMPEIAVLLDRLAALPGARLARMSGSGATCFALFADRAAAIAAAAGLAAAEPRWWIRGGSLRSGAAPLRPVAETR